MTRSATKLVPQRYPDHDLHLAMIATAVNAAIRGQLNNVIEVTLTANATSTTVEDARLSPFQWAQFDPLTANAAAELAAGTLYAAEADRAAGTWTLTHANASSEDRSFLMVVFG